MYTLECCGLGNSIDMWFQFLPFTEHQSKIARDFVSTYLRTCTHFCRFRSSNVVDWDETGLSEQPTWD